VILRRVSRRDASVAELGGAVRDLAILSRTLMARHLDSATVRQRVSDVLTGPVSGRLGSKLVDAVVALLVGMLRRDPDAPPWMMSIFDRAESTLDVRTAIATALLEYEQKMPGDGRAPSKTIRPARPRSRP